MAEGGVPQTNLTSWSDNFAEQKDEICALEAIFEDTNFFYVLSCPNNEEDGTLHQLQLDIPVRPNEGDIEVHAWAPQDYDIETTQQETAAIQSPTKPTFERSESGRRWHSSFSVKYLSPISLEVTLPRLYPSKSPPNFSLSCLWLDAGQLGALCHQLDVRWMENEGMPVTYAWFDWIQNESLRFLGLEKSVMLLPHCLDCNSPDERDPRAIPECYDLRDSLLSLLRYDQEQDLREFSQSAHICEICFDEKAGKSFFRLNECLHHFCQDCLTSFCEVHVADGAVQQLSCPASKCTQILPPGIIKEVLGEEAYARWETLLLQRALDTMGDIVWCPRCNNAVIKESEETLSLGNCSVCFYSFCTACGDSWHQGSPCAGVAEKILELEEASKKQNTEIERKRKLRQAWILKMECLSRDTVKKISKPCPNESCRMDIVKFDGCNKVTCSKCGTYMCWLCGYGIQGYDHFNSGPVGGCRGMLFELNPDRNRFVFGGHLANRERPEGHMRVQDALDRNPGVAQNVNTCPRCKQRNLKESRNNHIRCWCCKSNFCFLCKEVITGNISQHFVVSSTCRQHTD